MRRSASSPFTTASKGTLHLRKTRISNALRSMRSSSTCRTRKFGGNVRGPLHSSACSRAASLCARATSSGLALRSLSSMAHVVPWPLPAEESASVEPLCSSRMCRVITRPSPVPPRPCNCPCPTCVNGSPWLSVCTSLGVRPIPVSTTLTHTAASSPLPLTRMRMVTRPPRSVNLIALDTTLLMHCCRRVRSPTCIVPSASTAHSTRSATSATPCSSALRPNVRTASSSSSLSTSGACTKISRPASIRSKSSMSETMFCARVEHECIASMHSSSFGS
mmetsp:Transcript_23429/g.60274  ORF Transcript_23429/g.60274 Transcript_23429/m.60274 type:complete len:277 (-) Transcript_23429:350-1180(-)